MLSHGSVQTVTLWDAPKLCTISRPQNVIYSKELIHILKHISQVSQINQNVETVYKKILKWKGNEKTL